MRSPRIYCLLLASAFMALSHQGAEAAAQGHRRLRRSLRTENAQAAPAAPRNSTSTQTSSPPFAGLIPESEAPPAGWRPERMPPHWYGPHHPEEDHRNENAPSSTGTQTDSSNAEWRIERMDHYYGPHTDPAVAEPSRKQGTNRANVSDWRVESSPTWQGPHHSAEDHRNEVPAMDAPAAVTKESKASNVNLSDWTVESSPTWHGPHHSAQDHRNEVVNKKPVNTSTWREERMPTWQGPHHSQDDHRNENVQGDKDNRRPANASEWREEVTSQWHGPHHSADDHRNENVSNGGHWREAPLPQNHGPHHSEEDHRSENVSNGTEWREERMPTWQGPHHSQEDHRNENGGPMPAAEGEGITSPSRAAVTNHGK